MRCGLPGYGQRLVLCCRMRTVTQGRVKTAGFTAVPSRCSPSRWLHNLPCPNVIIPRQKQKRYHTRRPFAFAGGSQLSNKQNHPSKPRFNVRSGCGFPSSAVVAAEALLDQQWAFCTKSVASVGSVGKTERARPPLGGCKVMNHVWVGKQQKRAAGRPPGSRELKAAKGHRRHLRSFSLSMVVSRGLARARFDRSVFDGWPLTQPDHSLQ